VRLYLISIVLFILLQFSVFSSNAQEIPAIEGRVIDAATGLPLAASHIIIEGTLHAAVADELGRFSFSSLSPGKYNLRVSHIGYETAHIAEVAISYGTESIKAIRLVPNPIMLPTVEVEADIVPTEGKLSGGSVITAKTIRRSLANDVVDVLAHEGLATITSDGSPGGKKSVSLRGSGSDQVLVLIDGVPINEAADGIADLSQVPLAEVHQIEVYPQAPASLGTNSIGGVINIITVKPGGKQNRIEIGFSEFGERRATAVIGPEVTGWNLLSFIEHRESTGEYKYQIVTDDGLDVYTRNLGNTLFRKTADYRRDNFSLKVYPPGILNFEYRKTMLFRHNPDYLPESVLEHKSTTADDRQEFNFAVSEGNAWYRPRLNFRAAGYKQITITDYGTSYPTLYDKTELNGEAYYAELSWRRKNLFWDDIHFGSGIKLERLWSDDLRNNYAERLHKFGYIQVQGNPFKSVELPVRTGLITGVRADLYPRIGLEVGKGTELFWTVRAELAGAYRLPSFNSLFWQEDLQAEGNPNLKPERSRNEEISAMAGFKYIELDVSYFNRKITDLIYWRLDFDNRWKPLNVAEAWIYGTEYNLKGNNGKGLYHTEVSLSHRWMRAINFSGEPNTHGKLLTYRPENTTTFSFRQYLDSFILDVSSRWVSRRYSNEANTKSLSPYKVWDVGMSKDFTFSSSDIAVIVKAQIRNLFNDNYRLVPQAPLPLREFWFSLSLKHL